MIGDIHLIGGKTYIENNTSGTLQKCAPMKWYWQIILYVITKYKKMGYDETMDFIASHPSKAPQMKHDIINWFPFYCGFHFKRFDKPQYGCYAWRMCLGYIEVRKWAMEMPK